MAGLLVVGALAGGGGIAAAGGGDNDPAAAGKVGGPPAGGGVPADLLAATRSALNGLVADGTIDQSQADAVQSRVASGSVEPREVVSSGVLNQAQMDRVNDVLVAIKRGFAPSP